MCGIAGIFSFRSPPELSPLDEMSRALAHRGPDDAGAVHLPDGGLAVRRLAIQDPGRGHQPLSDHTGRWWVAINGEVYNHEALRKEWGARGTPFRTSCDTEVVAELVSELGFPRALEEFEGMFALAAYDRQERVLWLARDRMGEKPLYYSFLPGGVLVFASELKGLLVHPAVSRRLDRTALAQYLLFEFVPTPRSIYHGIQRLEPASWLRLDASGLQRGTYWHLPSPAGGSGGPWLLRHWARRLLLGFQVSVLSRRRADVPLAYLLSGGLDSSAVLAVAARQGARELVAFTVSFDEPSFDESRPAAEACRAFGCDHRVLRFGPENFLEVLDELGERLDEPLADSGLPVSWYLMRRVREAGYKAVLSGDGGDELLGGYPTHLAHGWVGVARPLGPALRALLARLPVSYENVSLDYKARRFTEGLGLPLPRRNQLWLGAFLPSELPPELSRLDPWAEVEAWLRGREGLPPACQAMLLDQRLYLGDGVLVKVDRASQAHGVEVRTPFLDHRFVELAARVPVGLKLRAGRTKAVWRQALRGLLPPSLLRRPKKGFGTPVGPWLRGPLSHLLDGLEERLEGLFPPEEVRRLRREHAEGRADHRRRLWALLVLARWREGPWGPR